MPVAGRTTSLAPWNVTETDSIRMPALRTTAKCRWGPLEYPVLPD